MLYQVILTDGELDLLRESLQASVEHYEEYCQDEDAYQVKQLMQSIEIGTMKF